MNHTFIHISFASVSIGLSVFLGSLILFGGSSSLNRSHASSQDTTVRIADVNSASCERQLPAAIDLTVLDATIKAQIVHLARLDAEVHDREEIALPEGLQTQQNAGPVASALLDEHLAFAARKEALASQVASLNMDKALVEREIEFSKAKEVALERQSDLLQRELNNISGLLYKGLTLSANKLVLEQAVLQSETKRLDVKLSILKAQQEVNKIERNIAERRNQWRNEALAEFSKTQTTLAALSRQLEWHQTRPALPIRRRIGDSEAIAGM
jgi:hypothetical protein